MMYTPKNAGRFRRRMGAAHVAVWKGLLNPSNFWCHQVPLLLRCEVFLTGHLSTSASQAACWRNDSYSDISRAICNPQVSATWGRINPINKKLIRYFRSKWKLWLFPAATPHLISSPIYFTVAVNYIVPVLFPGIYFPVFCMKVVDNMVCVSPWRFGTSESRLVKGFGDNPYCFK